MPIVWVPFFSAALVAIALSLLLSRGHALPMDVPNERSLHARPVPRVGGVVIVSVGLSFLFLFDASVPGGWECLLLAMLSFLDDRRNLPIWTRLPTHFLVASFALWDILPVRLSWLIPVLVLTVVWSTNLFNFMDGADGMAGGMALAGFLAYGVAAFLAGELVFARVFLAFGGAAGGFLIFNFHPARVFMGDGGSIPLGFLFAVWGVAGALKGIWSPLFPVVVLAPFWVDATVTLLRRVLRGESFWKSHRTHYYQRVVQMGWGHRRTALLWYGAMVFCCVFALLFLRTPSLPEGLLSLVLLPLSAVALGWVDWRWARRSPGPGESRLEV